MRKFHVVLKHIKAVVYENSSYSLFLFEMHKIKHVTGIFSPFCHRFGFNMCIVW